LRNHEETVVTAQPTVGSFEEEAKRAKRYKKGKKILGGYHPFLPFFAPLCPFCFLFKKFPVVI
jgi:hypothetical protein